VYRNINFSSPILEAEKRPGKGTPTYLIVDSNNVSEIESADMSFYNMIWSWSDPVEQSCVDAEWLPCKKVLVALSGSSRQAVILKPSDSGADIVGTISITSFNCYEATMIETGNILLAGQGKVLESKWELGKTTNDDVVWEYSTPSVNFYDVEEKGIINLAKIEYKDPEGDDVVTLAGVCLPIAINSPYIVATKTVEPAGHIKPGDIATYTITYTNTGSGIATNVTITDQIPAGMEYIPNSASQAGSLSTTGGEPFTVCETDTPITHIRWTITELAPNATGSVIFRIKVKE
jgi:uncharacterized repeat protein (TIGR01451 family)